MDCCAIILAGGLNSRMGGRNKALLDVHGQRIVDRIIKVLKTLFDEILLVARDPAPYRHLPVNIVEDLFDARSSLTGIHAGLSQARAGFGFVVPCDAPFLQPDLIRAILEEIRPDTDVVIPCIDGFYQPLCAVYAKQCLPHIQAMLERGDYKIINFFGDIRLKTVPLEKLEQADPEQRSFINVNTPEVYRLFRGGDR